MYAQQLETLEERSDVAASSVAPMPNTSAFKPETPFLPEPEYDRVGEAHTVSVEPLPSIGNYREAIESPFITQYERAGVNTESAESALHRDVMEELYDEEFEMALEDLVNNVRGAFDDRFNSELGYRSAEAEQQMWMYLQPLQAETEMALDRLIEGLMQIDNESLTETQLESYLESFEYQTNFQQPEFENFFKKLWKKAKKFAKKGLKVLKKLSPVHIVLAKLKKLVKPLLRRVLKFALNKVPARWRPIASKLAYRFLKGALGEIDESEFHEELITFEHGIERAQLEALDSKIAAPPPSALATELDSVLAGYLVEGESYENDPSVIQYLTEEHFENENAADALDRARDRFIREIGSVQSEEEAIAKVENFIPAILMGLKLGIKLIGRRRVVNLLAKLVAKLISRFVGRQAAVPLSRALVDAGLRMVSLETAAEDANYSSGEIVAETIQQTIDELVTSAPDEAYEDEELLELYVQEAFDNAVARNFPPRLVRPSLRSSPDSKGTWILLPRGRRRKRYKKFTETFDIKLNAPMARQIMSFGGRTLYGFLRDQMGVPIDKGRLLAKVHLYEGIRGTSLSDISHLERGVEGLGSRARTSWMRIHPLTPEAAAILIPNHVGLARPTSPRFLANRTRTEVGQRFYYLEIPGARILRAPAAPRENVGSRSAEIPPPARGSEVNATIDFPNRQILIFDFLSEAQVTELAQAVRQGTSRVAIAKVIRETLSSAVAGVLSGSLGNHLTVIREGQSEESQTSTVALILKYVGEPIGKKLVEFVIKELLRTMKSDGNALAHQFVKAAESYADGVTIVFALSQIDDVFDVITGNVTAVFSALAHLKSAGVTGVLKVRVKPGFHRS